MTSEETQDDKYLWTREQIVILDDGKAKPRDTKDKDDAE